MKCALAAVMMVFALALSAPAQTNDQLYRSWRWWAPAGSPRMAGLAGAGVALSDDATALAANPATMVTLKRSELVAAASAVGSGTTSVGDELGPSTGPGFVGGAAILGPKLAVGGYLRQVRRGQLGLAEFAVGGSRYGGHLDAQIVEGGFTGAYRVGRRLSVGLRVSGSHLKLEGYLRRWGSAGITLESGAAAGDTRITAAAGVLYEAGGGVVLGATVEPGASWTATRTANDPTRGIPLDPGSEYELRQPSRVSSAVAWTVGPKLLVVGQADYVRYSEIANALVVRPGAAVGPAAAYQLSDAVEGRFGAEVSLPAGRVSLQLRAGVASEGAAGLRYAGADAAEAAVWSGGERRNLITAGGSVVMRSLRLDAAAMLGGDQRVLSAGVRVRF